METIFIYSKEGKIKCLNIETSRTLHSTMIENGWVHVHTLNPCVFIEYLFKSSDTEIINSVRELINK